MTNATMAPPSGSYPVQFDVDRPPHQSRLLNFPLGIGLFIRAILLIPHLVILYFFNIVAEIIYFIATFAILFTGKFPNGMFGFVVGYMRWQANVYAYLFGLYDAYPPFSMDTQAGYPARLTVEYPLSSSRLLNFPFIGIFIKMVLLIPHFVCILLLSVVAYIILIIAPFAVLFTGSFPAGMHSFLVGTGRWGQRLTAYMLALTDRYPPFSMS